jgi:oxygen-independent coproporphyrinogen-3 oxidase
MPLTKNTAGVYVHIPFCDHKCIYCDFYSITTTRNTGDYLLAVLKELEHYGAEFRDELCFDTIFFGGGTPSFMEPGYIGAIVRKIRDSFHVAPDAEITLETNPGTVDDKKLRAFREIGINRLSIGIQSFDDRDLRFLTRIHDSGTAIDTVNAAVKAGYANISIDLIFNLPGQTKNAWRKNLETAVSLPVQHISAYSLILEKGTILNKMVLDGSVTIADDDHDADLYELTMSFLRGHGYQQYEVSNFAREGGECKHNNHYWQYDNYLGIGTSAHSSVNGKRWKNLSALNLYHTAIQTNGSAVCWSEVLTEEQRREEYMMLALRHKGISENRYRRLFGESFRQPRSQLIAELIANGYLEEYDDTIKLTAAGYAVCDEILAKF